MTTSGITAEASLPVQTLHQRYCERVGYELPQKLWATRQFRTLIQEAIK